MNKPTPSEYYDYSECIQFLINKHAMSDGFLSDRDYYGHSEQILKNYKEALQQTSEKYGNISFYSESLSKYTEEQKIHHEFFLNVKSKLDESLPPNLDFWGDVLIDVFDISNGKLITLSADIDTQVPEYIQIINWLLDEFGTMINGEKIVNLYVNW